MIIGFDGSRAFKQERTGTENYSYQLLKALSKIDKKNQYIVYISPHFIRVVAATEMKEFPSNFQFKQVNWKRFWTQGGLAIQTFKDKLDVLFVPSHTLPLLMPKGLKTVMTVHDLGAEYLPKMHQLKQRLYLNWITKHQFSSATRLIAVSKATKEDLIKKAGIKPEKISVVYEGFDSKLFKPSNDTVVSGLREYFLFVGTVQPRKNLDRLIRAFAIIARGPASSVSRRASSTRFARSGYASGPSSLSPLVNTNLVLVGSKGWMSDEIYKLPKKLGIGDKVKFLGYVPDDKMPALYSNALALVFPSLFEGFGLPILEAQACGCPVITSNTSSMPEVAGPPAGGGAILVDPGDIDSISSAMIEVMDNKLRKQLIEEGFKNVKRFSWEKCAVETLKVLNNLNG